jgi:hypothetical protein
MAHVRSGAEGKHDHPATVESLCTSADCACMQTNAKGAKCASAVATLLFEFNPRLEGSRC